MTKQFSPACERNAPPIADALVALFKDAFAVLEIGSGTGQHAVYFGARLPHLAWQCSDLSQNHPSILGWMKEAGLPNVLPPLTLEIGKSAWPAGLFDAVFTANTCHIMAWADVEILFASVPAILRPGGLLCIYGPFNYNGRFTGSGNEMFDASLKAQAPHMGIRDIERMVELAERCGLVLHRDLAMPANNRLLVFSLTASS